MCGCVIICKDTNYLEGLFADPLLLHKVLMPVHLCSQCIAKVAILTVFCCFTRLSTIRCSSTKVVFQVDPITRCAVQHGQSYAGSCLLLSAAKLAPVSVA